MKVVQIPMTKADLFLRIFEAYHTGTLKCFETVYANFTESSHSHAWMTPRASKSARKQVISMQRGWQAYTTPTFRGICTFAVFFSVSRPFLSLHSCYEGHLVLFCKEKIEPLDCVMANIKRSGLRDFRCYLRVSSLEGQIWYLWQEFIYCTCKQL